MTTHTGVRDALSDSTTMIAAASASAGATRRC